MAPRRSAALAKGLLGPGDGRRAPDRAAAARPEPGDGVLDVACGPGNFTRDFARVVGDDGLAVGIDASTTMLARAVRDTPRASSRRVAYVRGDAVGAAVPRRELRRASAASPRCTSSTTRSRALDHMARVLTPGGRIAILTSCRAAHGAAAHGRRRCSARAAGQRMFERDEITGALEERGFDDVRQRISGLAQFVGGQAGR